MESVPYLAFIRGLTKRQPMVVSSSFAVREKALSALPMTKGARDMLSTPPAITSSPSPDLMARAAVATASMLEPQRRFTVEPELPWADRRAKGPSGRGCDCPRPPDL